MAPKTPDGRDLRPVKLPDLSRVAESAQRQIRDRFAGLVKIVNNPNTPLLDLSNAYGEMGKLLMAAQYPAPAEACFLNAQSLDSSEFRWPYYLAHIYRTQGDSPKTQAMFERALELQPDDVSALVWLGNVYLEQGLADAAAPKFSKALALDERSLSARYGLARVALQKNDYRRAVTYLEEVLRMDPTASGAHFPLSLAYNALGDSKKAAEHVRQRRERDILPSDPLIVELDSLVESPQTYETLGIRALERQAFSEAAAHFRKGLELKPDDPALKFRLATAVNMMGDTRAAEALFEEVVRTSPDYDPAQYSLGVILQSKGQHREAGEHFQAALRQRPDYAAARLRLASSLRRLGKPDEALEQYQNVITSNPDNTEADLGYAMTLVQLGRYDEAAKRFAEEMKVHPEQPQFAHGLARLLAAAPDARVRNGQRAMTIVQGLIKQGRTLELGETMAMTLAELGEYQRAAAVQGDLLKAAGSSGMQNVVQRLSANLRLYEQGQPCRTPWTPEEMP